MRNIKFEKTNDNKLILTYFPILESMEDFKNRLPSHLRNCFAINTSILYSDINNVDENTGISFYVGDIEKDYIKLDSNVFMTEHSFFIFKEISIKYDYFIAYNNISILKKIDKIVKEDVYIGGPNYKAIPIETFKILIKNFPKTTELKKYSQQRISTLLKEYFPYIESYEKNFDTYIAKNNKKIKNSLKTDENLRFIENIELNLFNFKKLQKEFKELLDESTGIPEKTWQKYIHQLIQLLYPKYIQGFREVKIKGVEKKDKKPDFLLVDSKGYVDLLEIKKPETKIIRDSTYRNNYTPSYELAATIQQIEKYIYCLNRWGKLGEDELNKKYKKYLIEDIDIKLLNPKGLLILGRNSLLSHQQLNDFELIKRQFKNIAEIMTYDDLDFQINNIIKSLEYNLNNLKKITNFYSLT